MPSEERGFNRSLAEAAEFHRSGRLGQAEHIYLRLLSENPSHDGLYDLLGLIAYQRNHRGLACRWLRQALALVPGRAKTWRDLALPDQEQAGRFISRAASIEPDVAEHWFTLERAGGAEKALRRGIALEPAEAAAWMRMSAGLLALAFTGRALVAAQRAETISGKSTAFEIRELARPPTVACRIEPARLILDDGELSISPYFLSMKHAVVTGDFMVMPTPTQILIDGQVPDPADPLQLVRSIAVIGPRYALVRKGKARRVARAALLGGARNYYHWIIDHLPRLALFDPEVDRPLIVNADLAPFQIDSLRHLRLGEDRLLKLVPDDRIEVDDLTVPSLLTKSSLVHPAALVWLRKQFLSDGTAPDAPKRIYVSRREAKHRLLHDEREVVDVLRRRGVAVVTTEGMPVTRQAALFAAAELIVSVHGAALANLAFVSPGARVVEIDAEGSRRSFFSVIAAMNGAQYRRVTGRAVSPYALQYSDIILGERGLMELEALL